MPEISVVVPVRDGAASLPGLLRSLNSQDLDPARYEVIVVDNASRDASAEIAASFGARVGYEPVANRSRARNAGVALAQADLIAFTDADCLASPGWLKSLLQCRGRRPLVAGPVGLRTRANPNAIERFEASWRFDQARWVGQGWAATANLMVERAAFDALGGFDPGYRHIGEDVDFCLRAGRRGFNLGFCEAALVHHVAEHRIEPVVRRAFFHGYSSAQLMNRLGFGHVAWRHPRPLVSPGAALAWYGISSSMPRSERIAQKSLAVLTYAARVAGSIWATLRGAR
jgi:glycosyltransferase involved in cell wall biosynthesis